MLKALAIALVLLGLLACPRSKDSDDDGVSDDRDNCILAANPTQLDADGDGYGNRCDGDFDQDGAVAGTDYLEFRSAVQACQSGVELLRPCAVYDLNGDGVVGTVDGDLFNALLGGTPGPSCCAKS